MLSGVLYLKLCWKSVFRATHFALFIKLLTTERVIRRCPCHGMQVGYHYKYSRMGVSPSISAWPTIADLLLAHISQGVILPRRGGGGERHAQAETLCTHATAKYLLLHSEAIPPFSSSAQGKQFFLSGSILLCTTWWWYLHLGHQLKIREEKISWNANYRNLGSKWGINLIWHFGFGILSFGP